MNGQGLLGPATERLLMNTAVGAGKRLRSLKVDGRALSTSRLHRPSTRAFATTAGSAAAVVGAYALVRYAMHHRDHADEDHYEASAVSEYRLVSLHDLRRDDGVLAEIQEALLDEWGPFAPQDLDAMRAMARRAGRLVFVLGKEDGGRFRPEAVLQTARADTGGDPARLVERYPMFSTITRYGAWTSMARRGDTAVLLQITAIGDRSRGAGSLLRDAALHALPPEVKFALTTTPVDDFDLDATPDMYPPQVKFHFRGGARPSGFREGYKIAPMDAPAGGRQHHPNVVFMRYERLEDGSWKDVRQPGLRLTRPSRWSLIAAWLRRQRTPEVAETPETPAGAVAPA